MNLNLHRTNRLTNSLARILQRTISSILIAFSFIFFTNSAFGQNFHFDNWLARDGLPQNSIQQILQSKDGYIWLATEGGLSRFDGVKFSNYNVENTPALSSNRINALYETKHGDLLIATDLKGLALLRDGVFTNLSEILKNGVESIREIQELRDGSLVLFYSFFKMIFLDGVSYKRLANKSFGRREIDLIGVRFHGNPLFLESDKLLIFKEDLGINKVVKQIFAENKFTQISAEPSINQYWLADGNLLRLFKENKEFDRVDLSKIFPSTASLTIFNNQDKLYIINNQTTPIYVFDKNSKKVELFYADNLCDNSPINQIKTDQEGNVWIATSTCGLFKMRPNRFSYIGNSEYTYTENTYPVTLDGNGNILAGSHLHGLFYLNQNGNIQHKSTSELFNTGFITSIASKGNAIYVARISRNYVLKIEDKANTKLYFEDNSYEQCNALYISKNGKLLAGSRDALYELDGDILKKHPITKATSLNMVNTFLEDVENNLWIATDKKLLCWNPIKGKITYNSQDKTSESQFFRGLFEDSDHRIYAGSYGLGLTIIDHGKVYKLTTNDGLIENVVSTITEDKRGNIWLTGNRGLSRIKKSNLLAVISGKSKALNVVLYNEETDRLRSGEFNGGIQQAKCWLGDEKYVFPTIKGAVKVDFANMQENTLPPPVHIESLLYGDSAFRANSNLSIDYTGERLDIKYTALSFVSPMNVRFKYKMEGYDNQWIDAGAERKTSYSKIPPGNYVFKVIASNNEGVWNESGDQISIKIIPPFYMTWWFDAIFIIFAFGLTAFIVLYISIRVRKREKDKSALMDILPDMVFKVDTAGKCLEIYGNPSSPSSAEIALKGKIITEILPPEAAEKMLFHITEATESFEIVNFDYEINSNDVKRYFDGRTIAIDKKEVLCIIRDITDVTLAQRQISEGEKKLRKALEKEKKLLSRINEQQKLQLQAIINTEEAERKRIATDLHDGIGQLLSSVKINLGVANEKIGSEHSAETKALILKSKDAIDQITRELRSISYNLLPPSLEQFGLGSAISEEVNKLKVMDGMFIHFDCSTTSIRFDQKVEIILFRVFQEMLNNSLKHSMASQITIQLIEHSDQLVMMIEDNGKGFEIQKGFLKKDSSGLKNIYSRIALVDGQINLESTPNSGTSIIIKIPL